MIGRVYSIENLDKSIVYIGSTCRELTKRWTNHVHSYKSWLRGISSECAIYPYFFEHGYGEFNIRLLEIHNIESKKQLRQLEQLAIERHPNAINKNNAYRSQELSREKDRAYKQKYIENNYEMIIERRKNEYIKNRDQIVVKARERINCECGHSYNRSGKTQHLRSNKHRESLIGLQKRAD